MEHEIKNLKEFIHEKFESHEELEALRFKRIDELLSQYGRERSVSVLVARGFTNGQIGEKLDISEPTVKTHLRNIYSKTGVHDRAQLVRLMLESEADFWNVEYHKLMRRLQQAQDDKNKT